MRHVSRMARVAGMFAVAAAAATCRDTVTGPGAHARFNLVPSFTTAPDAPLVAISRVLVVVRRYPDLDSAAARLVDVPADTEPIRIDIQVAQNTPNELFRVTLAAIDAAGDTAYRGVADSVLGALVGTPPPVSLPLVYSGANTVVHSVTLLPHDTTVYVGSTAQLTATARRADNTPKADALIQFTSRDPSSVAVDQAGVVSAVKAKTAGTWVVATSANGYSDSAHVVTIAPVSTITLSVAATDTLTVTRGTSAKITAVLHDAEGNVLTGRAITWSSSKAAAVAVNDTGLVSGILTDSVAAVTATSEGHSATARVRVGRRPVASVTANVLADTVPVSGSVVLSASAFETGGIPNPDWPITWSTTSSGIIGFTDLGNGQVQVSGIASGSAVARASAGGQFADVAITVVSNVDTIAMSPTNDTLVALGDTARLTATPKDVNGVVLTGVAVTWTSLDPAVATVNGSGLVQAVANGTARIQASVDTITSIVPVVVSQAVATLAISRDTLRLAAVGDTGSIVGTPFDRNANVATNHPPAYASSDTAVATVSATGLVTLRAGGVATITVSAGGQVATAVVIKTPADVGIGVGIAGIRVTPATAFVRLGDTLGLTAEYVDASGNATPITPAWATSNTGRASVSAAGAVIANDTGSVQISATYQGMVGHADLTILPAPMLNGFSYSPQSLGGSSTSTVRFTVTTMAADPGAGISQVQVTFTAPGGSVTASCTAGTPTVGTAQHGEWDCVVAIPAGSPQGTWHATSLVLGGSITRSYNEAALAVFGPTTLVVNP